MRNKAHFVSDHIGKYPFAFSGIIVAGLINSIISFLLPVSIGEFFILHFHTGSSKGKLFNWLGLQVDTVQQFFLLFIILLTLKAMFGFIYNYGVYRQGELFVKDLREKIFRAQMQWDANVFAQHSYGKYLLRYSNDMKAVQGYFMKGVIGSVTNILFVITGFFLLSRIHTQLTIILSGLLLAVTIIIYRSSARQKPFIRASRSNRSSLLAFVSKSFTGFQKIKERGNEEKVADRFMLRSDNLYHANMRSNLIESLLQSLTPFLIFAMIGVLLWQMTLSYINISASDGLMMVLMLLMMQGALRKLLKVPGYLNKGKISLQKIAKLLDESGEEALGVRY